MQPEAQPAAAPAAVEAAAGDILSLPCRTAILIDQDTGTVLYEKNADQRVPIASITKVMTLLLTFEAIHAGKIDYDTKVPVSNHAASMGGSQICWNRGRTSPWTRCCGPSACPAPTMRRWRWPSWWGGGQRGILCGHDERQGRRAGDDRHHL